MSSTVIIIPTRLHARRFPNKPLKLIKKKEMILHVYETAIKAKIGEVFVATPDREIINIVKESGGQPILTKRNHPSGSDRVYEAYIKNNLEESVDLNVIKENLLNKQKRCQNEIDKINSRLNNKDFITRAPKHIVDQEKTNYNNLKKDIKKISLTVESL